VLVFLLLTACIAAQPDGPPRIGVTGAVPDLVAALRAAGAEPVAIQPGDAVDLATFAGLVLGPGADIHPSLYEQPMHSTTVLVSEERQEQDLALALEAIQFDVPVLGVCLGAQELVVAYGGALVQDLPSQVGTSVDHREPHAVTWTESTPLSELATEQVVSDHHQAADGLPDRLKEAARSSDGVIEAFYASEGLVWGVQFHPEQSEATQPLLDRWVKRATNHESKPSATKHPIDRSLPVCRVVRTPFDEPHRTDRKTLEARLGSTFGDHRASFKAGHKHAGIDLTTTPGETVRAICPGKVVDMHLGFPHKTVVVEHLMADGTTRYSSYKHVTDVAVALGDRVLSETAIGRVFHAEEQKEAPWGVNHLHFEMRHSIADQGSASWLSMSMEELETYALDPRSFFAQHLVGPPN